MADFDGLARIWIARMDGTGIRKIWSDPRPSDGRQIAYSSSDGLSPEAIWVMQPDGTHSERLGSDGSANSQPAWSPDGRSIAFISTKDGTRDLWIMNADGSRRHKVVDSAAQKGDPAFSPAGDRIVCSATSEGRDSLLVVNILGNLVGRTCRGRLVTRGSNSTRSRAARRTSSFSDESMIPIVSATGSTLIGWARTSRFTR